MRLTVRGKARIGRGLHRRHRPQRLCPRQAYVVRAAVHPAPGLPQRRRHRRQLPVLRVPQGDIAARGRRRAEIGGRHDPVGYHPVGAAVERAPRRYGDDRAACAPHLRAHGAQKLLQVGDLRLPRRVADHRVALCAAGGQHGILRGAHAGHGQHDLAAPAGAPPGTAGCLRRRIYPRPTPAAPTGAGRWGGAPAHSRRDSSAPPSRTAPVSPLKRSPMSASAASATGECRTASGCGCPPAGRRPPRPRCSPDTAGCPPPSPHRSGADSPRCGTRPRSAATRPEWAAHCSSRPV